MGEPQVLRRSSRRQKQVVQTAQVQLTSKNKNPKSSEGNDVEIFREVEAIESSGSEDGSEGEFTRANDPSLVDRTVIENDKPELSVLGDKDECHTDPIYDLDWTPEEKASTESVWKCEVRREREERRLTYNKEAC